MTKIDSRTNSLPNISSEHSEVSSTNNAAEIKNQGNVDQWDIPRNAHGCPGCPHPALGMNTPEPPKTLVNSRPAVTMKDQEE